MFARIATILRTPLGVVAAMLPRRWWPTLEEHVPAAGSAFAASVLTLMAGTALGLTGFLEYLTATASANNEAFLGTAARLPTEKSPVTSGLSVLTIFTFFFMTPSGWASMYLGLSGFVRTLGAHFDDPHGDFLLTLADAGLARLSRRSADVRASHRLHRLEGPERPDRVVRGEQAGLPMATIVIVSSRLKPEWIPGAVVLTSDGAFRIIHVEDRTWHGRLRHLYGLAPHTDLEVFRHTVAYEFAGGSRPLDD